ncbi:homogentisate 1,2-dioxygenase [mine drainage metagenome]|uniref:Homogentisate 1,2-dioxygenase n=1 Tax=mine drainage metagenome TaxID=410659 RepID=T1CN53_9ZZZZ
MVFYVKQGKMPKYRHTFDERSNLLREELFGEESFDGLYSLLYHRNEPTRVLDVTEKEKKEFDPSDEKKMIHRHLKTSGLHRQGDLITGRRYLFYNDRIRIGLIKPTEKMRNYFRHAICEQLFFLHRGSGTFSSVFGTMHLRTGDYLYIPKGTTWSMAGSEDLEIVFMESKDRIDLPARYRNGYGSSREGTPFYTRDIEHSPA